jgi:hypothetical protein
MHHAKLLVASLLLVGSAVIGSQAVAEDFAVRPWYRPYGGGYGGYGYGGGWGGGGTAAGNYMQGMSTVIRSAGEYNLATAQAGVSYEEARSKYLDNNKKWSENYFEMKERRQALEVQQREINKHSNEALNAAAKSSLPRTLGPNALDPVTGQITWPEVLQGGEFADLRKQVEQQFELRTKTSNVAGTAQKIHAATQEMSSILRKEIEKVPANEYIAARKFLDGLDYTARTGSI